MKTVPIQKVEDTILEQKKVELYIKREDQIDTAASGNKWWKLKYNIEEIKRQKHTKLLTFGGAFSNHIYATSAIAKQYNISSIGIIRGEATYPLNATLTFAKKNRMHLIYVNRKQYRDKYNISFLQEIEKKFGKFYLIPEGGSNLLAVKGSSEMLGNVDTSFFNYICCSCGTGVTLAGLILAANKNTKIIGFSALKGENTLQKSVKRYLNHFSIDKKVSWKINTNYHFGGYAKITPTLINFINTIEKEQKILLDPIYTAKMLFGIYDLCKRDFFPENSKILAIHTGGLQGWEGIKTRYPHLLSTN